MIIKTRHAHPDITDDAPGIGVISIFFNAFIN